MFNNLLEEFASSLGNMFGALIKGSIHAGDSIKVFDDYSGFANAGLERQFWYWLGVAFSLLLIVGIINLIEAVIKADLRGLIRVPILFVLAFPTIMMSLILANAGLNVSREITNGFLALLDQDLAQMMLNLTGLGTFLADDPDPWALGVQTVIVPPGTSILLMIIFLGILCILAGVLAIMMIIQSLVFTIMIITMPLAMIFVGQKRMGKWAAQWVEVMIALLLAKPLCVAVLGVVIAVIGGESTQQHEGSVTELFGFIVACCALILAIFSPFAAMRLCKWAGGSIREAFAQRPSVMQNVQRTRMLTASAKDTRARAAGLLAGMRSRGGRGSSAVKPSSGGKNFPQKEQALSSRKNTQSQTSKDSYGKKESSPRKNGQSQSSTSSLQHSKKDASVSSSSSVKPSSSRNTTEHIPSSRTQNDSGKNKPISSGGFYGRTRTQKQHSVSSQTKTYLTQKRTKQ